MKRCGVRKRLNRFDRKNSVGVWYEAALKEENQGKIRKRHENSCQNKMGVGFKGGRACIL